MNARLSKWLDEPVDALWGRTRRDVLAGRHIDGVALEAVLRELVFPMLQMLAEETDDGLQTVLRTIE